MYSTKQLNKAINKIKQNKALPKQGNWFIWQSTPETISKHDISHPSRKNLPSESNNEKSAYCFPIDNLKIMAARSRACMMKKMLLRDSRVEISKRATLQRIRVYITPREGRRFIAGPRIPANHNTRSGFSSADGVDSNFSSPPSLPLDSQSIVIPFGWLGEAEFECARARRAFRIIILFCSFQEYRSPRGARMERSGRREAN